MSVDKAAQPRYEDENDKLWDYNPDENDKLWDYSPETGEWDIPIDPKED